MSKRRVALLVALVFMAVLVLQGCDSPVANVVLSDKYENNKIGESKTEFKPEDTVYNYVRVCETPKGTEVEVKWYFGDKEIKKEKQLTPQDMKSELVYKLDSSEKSEKGEYKVETYYKGKIANTMKFSVK